MKNLLKSVFMGFLLVAETGFEPMTFGLWARRATELLYSAVFVLWMGIQDSNLWISVPKTEALPLGESPIRSNFIVVCGSEYWIRTSGQVINSHLLYRWANSEYFCLVVDREGFEPSVPLRVRILSRDVVSAAHPSIQVFLFSDYFSI